VLFPKEPGIPSLTRNGECNLREYLLAEKFPEC
jgi:hypothetical protein